MARILCSRPVWAASGVRTREGREDGGNAKPREVQFLGSSEVPAHSPFPASAARPRTSASPSSVCSRSSNVGAASRERDHAGGAEWRNKGLRASASRGGLVGGGGWGDEGGGDGREGRGRGREGAGGEGKGEITGGSWIEFNTDVLLSKAPADDEGGGEEGEEEEERGRREGERGKESAGTSAAAALGGSTIRPTSLANDCSKLSGNSSTRNGGGSCSNEVKSTSSSRSSSSGSSSSGGGGSGSSSTSSTSSTSSGGGRSRSMRSSRLAPTTGPASLSRHDLSVLTMHLSTMGSGGMVRVPREVYFSGCLNESYEFNCQHGRFFVKVNRKFPASAMFEGEAAVLQAMHDTQTLRVPRPLVWGDIPREHGEDSCSSFLIMEHLQFKPFAMLSADNQAKLGDALACMHLASSGLPTTTTTTTTTTNSTASLAASSDSSSSSSRSNSSSSCSDISSRGDDDGAYSTSSSRSWKGFGFYLTTMLGVMPLNNDWSSSWTEFFVTQRLADRLHRVLQLLGDMEAVELAAIRQELLQAAQCLLNTRDNSDDANNKPSILHGDLWVGNSGVVSQSGEPAVFDPAGFYGDPEFDLAFQDWKPQPGFPGLSNEFYDAYHSLVPRTSGFKERQSVYQLFHLLNHVAIYGREYYPHAMAKAKQVLAAAKTVAG